ncbi:MAG TPA: hypothetical protein VKE69_04375 [Planctomycetota bacterium]|nr:hypothetical protein [Planctomycetota bacterium]
MSARSLAACAALSLALACQTRVATFTMISTRPLPWQPPIVGRGEGSDTGHQLYGAPIPLLSNPSGYPSENWGVDKAMEVAGGNLLVDADLEWTLWNVLYLYGEWSATASGKVAKVPAPRDAGAPQVRH